MTHHTQLQNRGAVGRGCSRFSCQASKAPNKQLRQVGRSANRQFNHRPEVGVYGDEAGSSLLLKIEPALAGFVSIDPDFKSGELSANRHLQLIHRPEVGGCGDEAGLNLLL